MVDLVKDEFETAQRWNQWIKIAQDELSWSILVSPTYDTVK